MDGPSAAPAPALPPIPGANFPPQRPPAYPAQYPTQNPSAQPVGRPLADPEAQQAKVERSQERSRLNKALPKQAVDSKVHIYRLKGSKPAAGARPVMTILVSQLETAQAEGTESDDFIKGKLEEKYSEGRFQCHVFDNKGKRVPDVQPWDVALGEDEDLDDDRDEEQDLDENDLDPRGRGNPFEQQQYPMPMFAPSPPPAPPMDPQNLASTLRAERTDEARRSGEMMSVVTAMLQATQGQSAQAAQSTAQMQANFQTQMMAMQAQARADADAREERESKRKAEFRQTLMTLLPMVLPMIQAWFAPKDKGLDPATVMLLEMVKQKAPDADILKSMSSLMGEMTKQQMQLQGAGAQAAVQMQAEASSMVFKNMMATMKEMMEARKGDGEEKEESTMEQIAKIASAVIPALQQNQAQAVPQPPQGGTPPAVESAQVQQQQAHVPPAAPARQKRAAPRQPPMGPSGPVRSEAAPAPAPKEAKPVYTEQQKIAGGLTAIANLSLGAIPAENRLKALQWVTTMLPEKMIAAIKAGEKEQVIALGTAAVISDANLMKWFAEPNSVAFLEEALEDIRHYLNGTLTEAHAIAAVQKNIEFVAARKRPAPLPGPGSRKRMVAAASAAPVVAAAVQEAPAAAAPPAEAPAAPAPTEKPPEG